MSRKSVASKNKNKDAYQMKWNRVFDHFQEQRFDRIRSGKTLPEDNTLDFSKMELRINNFMNFQYQLKELIRSNGFQPDKSIFDQLLDDSYEVIIDNGAVIEITHNYDYDEYTFNIRKESIDSSSEKQQDVTDSVTDMLSTLEVNEQSDVPVRIEDDANDYNTSDLGTITSNNNDDDSTTVVSVSKDITTPIVPVVQHLDPSGFFSVNPLLVINSHRPWLILSDDCFPFPQIRMRTLHQRYAIVDFDIFGIRHECVYGFKDFSPQSFGLPYRFTLNNSLKQINPIRVRKKTIHQMFYPEYKWNRVTITPNIFYEPEPGSNIVIHRRRIFSYFDKRVEKHADSLFGKMRNVIFLDTDEDLVEVVSMV